MMDEADIPKGGWGVILSFAIDQEFYAVLKASACDSNQHILVRQASKNYLW